MIMTFPSAEEVRQLADQPSPEIELEELVGALFVEQWSMVGPLPTQIGDVAYRSKNAWERDVEVETARLQGGRTSEAMNCVAQQSAHFYAEYESMPPIAVGRFMAARCGWVGTQPSVSVQYWQGHPPMEEAWRQVRGGFLQSITDHGGDIPLDVGLWGGRVDGMTYFVMAQGRRTLTVQQRSHLATDSVVLEGQVLDPQFDAISGLVTRGEYDVEYCESDEGVRFPEFRITCPLDQGDNMAWFEFILDIQGQNWNHSGFAGLLWRGEADNTYRAAPWRRAWAEEAARSHMEVRAEEVEAIEGGDMEAQIDAYLAPRPLFGEHNVEGEALEERMVALTNMARELAGRSPVTFEREQTQTNTALAPHFFRALRDDDWSRLDELASSILAGWDVDGPILSASLRSASIFNGDERELVDSLLELPAGRQIVMDPLVSRVAFGTLREQGIIWTVVSGYRRVPALSGAEMVAQALDTINEARDDAGNAPLEDSSRYMQASVLLSDSIVAGDRKPGEAAERVMMAMSRNLNTRVISWTILTDDLERFHLPDHIVVTPDLPAAVVVAPWQGEDEPWSMYRVIIITPQVR